MRTQKYFFYSSVFIQVTVMSSSVHFMRVIVTGMFVHDPRKAQLILIVINFLVTCTLVH